MTVGTFHFTLPLACQKKQRLICAFAHYRRKARRRDHCLAGLLDVNGGQEAVYADLKVCSI
jgi:hypothetical protein